MADCTTVFETLKGFLPMNILEKAIEESGADRRTRKFTVLRQLNTLMYAQLNPKESLRHTLCVRIVVVPDKKSYPIRGGRQHGLFKKNTGVSHQTDAATQ